MSSSPVSIYLANLDMDVSSNQYTVIPAHSLTYDASYDFIAEGTISLDLLNKNLLFIADQQEVEPVDGIDTGFYACNFQNITQQPVSFIDNVAVKTMNGTGPTSKNNLDSKGNLPYMIPFKNDTHFKVSESYSYIVAAHLFNQYTAAALFNNTLDVESKLDASLNQTFLDTFNQVGTDFAVGSTQYINKSTGNILLTKDHNSIGYKIQQAILSSDPGRYADMKNFKITYPLAPDWLKTADWDISGTHYNLKCSIEDGDNGLTPAYAFSIGFKTDDTVMFTVTVKGDPLTGQDLQIPGTVIPDIVYLVKLKCV